MESLGKLMLTFGLVMACIGLALLYADKLPFLNWLGRLPGDIAVKGERYSFFFPIVTCLVISIVLTILANIFRR
jgi:hypothetical protein